MLTEYDTREFFSDAHFVRSNVDTHTITSGKSSDEIFLLVAIYYNRLWIYVVEMT